jgi:hypothetical protein
MNIKERVWKEFPESNVILLGNNVMATNLPDIKKLKQKTRESVRGLFDEGSFTLCRQPYGSKVLYVQRDLPYGVPGH